MYDVAKAALLELLDQLKRQGNINEEILAEKVLSVSTSFGLDPAASERLRREMEEVYWVTQSSGTTIHTEFDPWLTKARERDDFNEFYWPRLKNYLPKKIPYYEPRLRLDELTDEILDHLMDPTKPGPWRRRGMVMGEVQSGKTANYAALICKAADMGFKAIILLAGVTNRLRRQTQERIDLEFIGRDTLKWLTGENTRIGVAENSTSKRHPLFATTKAKDFNIQAARQLGVSLDMIKEPMIFVLKKNYRSLETLRDWIKAANPTGNIDFPMLLIDDEADNASINTSRNPQNVTKINGLIREILQLFNRNCYVAYTATPFANIFIDPDSWNDMLQEDLFPEHFIKLMAPPNNYVSRERVFSDELGEGMLREIDDYEEILPLNHKKDREVEDLPETLFTAIRAFVVTRAIRVLRGQGTQHCTMMVNVTRFINVQGRVAEQITRYLDLLKAAVEMNALLGQRGLKSEHLKALKETWDQEFHECEPGNWSDIQKALPEAIRSIEPEIVNSNSARLDYDDDSYRDTGLHVIAVGGFALSRGLTLEGLTISYVLRNSLTYDTILQMGRWFGYRPGFEDLCRLWLTVESDGYYRFISAAIDDLQDNLRIMDAARKIPRDFGLKVRSDPNGLLVTARNKMGTATRWTIRKDLSAQQIEACSIHDIENINSENRTKLSSFFGKLGSPVAPEDVIHGDFNFWQDVPVDLVEDLMKGFKWPDAHQHPALSREVRKESLVEAYIQDHRRGHLSRWDVVIPNGKGPVDSGFGSLEVKKRERWLSREDEDKILRVYGSRMRVGDTSDPKIGLSVDTEFESLEWKGARKFNWIRQRPLLVVHVIEPEKPNKKKHIAHVDWEQAPVTFSINFPRNEDFSAEEYDVWANSTWVQKQQERLREEEEDEDNEAELSDR